MAEDSFELQTKYIDPYSESYMCVVRVLYCSVFCFTVLYCTVKADDGGRTRDETRLIGKSIVIVMDDYRKQPTDPSSLNNDNMSYVTCVVFSPKK